MNIAALIRARAIILLATDAFAATQIIKARLASLSNATEAELLAELDLIEASIDTKEDRIDAAVAATRNSGG